MTQNPTDGPIHGWFGLSYSNYQVLHRTLMQSMPIEWQTRMVACLEELAAAYAHLDRPEVFKVGAATQHVVSDMTQAQLKQAGITADWFRGETPPERLAGDELGEWEAEHENPDGPAYYDRDGREMDPHEYVLLLAADPIPHYDRGRAYVRPAIGEAAA